MLCPDDEGLNASALRASVPVGDTGGYETGMITVMLPVGTADPDTRLRPVSGETVGRVRGHT